MPAMPASGPLARGSGAPSSAPVRRSDLLGEAHSGLRRSDRAHRVRRPGPRRARRKSDRTHVHRRSFRRRALRGAPCGGPRERAGLQGSRRRTEASRRAHHRGMPLRAPGNKPLPSELDNCHEYLQREIALLKRPRVFVALGALAFGACLRALAREASRVTEAEAALHARGALPIGQDRVFTTYHPSQQNTFTGKLTPAMLRAVLRAAVAEAKRRWAAHPEVASDRGDPRLRHPAATPGVFDAFVGTPWTTSRRDPFAPRSG